MIDSKTAGSRAATKVRVVSTATQPTRYAGQVGTVVTFTSDHAMVRLPSGSVLPFAQSTLKELK